MAIPAELEAQVRALNVNFSKLVRELIEQWLKGNNCEVGVMEYKLSEIENRLEDAYSLLDELKADRDALKAQLEALKEQQKEHLEQEQEHQVARECRYFSGIKEIDGKERVVCMEGMKHVGHPWERPPRRCSRQCPQYEVAP